MYYENQGKILTTSLMSQNCTGQNFNGEIPQILLKSQSFGLLIHLQIIFTLDYLSCSLKNVEIQ